MTGYQNEQVPSYRAGEAAPVGPQGDPRCGSLAALIQDKLSRLIGEAVWCSDVPTRALWREVPLIHRLRAQVQRAEDEGYVWLQLVVVYGISIPETVALIHPYLVRWTQETLQVPSVQVQVDVEDLWFASEPEAS